ncbi:hypothetical protein BD779DRAFT_1644806 [Infundibulicybe gibba]|nr:hypothetical protein BD779DRAFT_1644806 [Infundibulicybe gibba]
MHASVEQPTTARPPILTAGDISPEVMRKFEYGCQLYFIQKDIADDAQVRHVLGCFRDFEILEWMNEEWSRIQALTFRDFMAEMRARYLEKNWEAGVRRKLLSSRMGKKTVFLDWCMRMRAMNSLLVGTESHLGEKQLMYQIEAGLEARLAQECILKNVSLDWSLNAWMITVKGLDEDRRAR